MTDVAQLGASTYVAIATYRKDGSAVATPVWIALDGDSLVFWTVASSWKVKRIGNNPAVAVVQCDLRGKKHRGEWVRGTAELLDPHGSQMARDRIAKKYGLLGWLSVRGSELRRGRNGSIGVRVTLD